MTAGKKRGTPAKKGDVRRIEHFSVIGLFSGLVVMMSLTVWELGRSGYLTFFQRWTAKAAGWFMRLSAIDARTTGNMIYLPEEVWLVNTECTAAFVMVVYSAFILVYPAKLSQKTSAFAIGLPVIFAANLLRLVIMAWLMKLEIGYAKAFHDYVWQVGFILMIVSFWLIWIKRVLDVGKSSVLR